MTQALTRYEAVFQADRTRRTKPPTRKGLDQYAAQAGARIRYAATRLGRLRREAKLVDAMAGEMHALSEAALDDRIASVRVAMARRHIPKEGLREAVAVVREVARRATGEEAYVVQLIGALSLYHGRIVEMLTGEGKTLTGSIAAPLLAWRHTRLHVFTVNDYLAQRDAESRRETYERCGLSVGSIGQEMSPGERERVYARSIVYGTPKQITADYLRDQLRMGRAASAWAGRARLLSGSRGAGPLIPGLHAAMVDEADAVLIDEGVVPLIIARSRREDDMERVYREARQIGDMLDEGPDYSVDHLRRKAELTRRGKHRSAHAAQQMASPIWKAPRRAEELVRQAIVAARCYIRGRQYEIVDGQVVIVDEYTGRFLKDRSWEHGLHQAVEAKEGLEVTADRETLARLSFQRFFRTYPFLCGMTGTAADARGEMERVYERPVTIVPTNKPVVRTPMPTRVFADADTRWNAIADSIELLRAEGRPVLVGTRSIEASETLGERLSVRGVPHRVLNANFDQEEADMIAEAGRPGAVTVATNMAGRGTDIKPDADVLAAGGLHVILSELHTARRIDRQFIGRAGRQGDPGSSQVFFSLEDELLTLHAPRTAAALRSKRGKGELNGPSRRLALVTSKRAQHAAEARGRTGRVGVLRQDDWIDKHLPGG